MTQELQPHFAPLLLQFSVCCGAVEKADPSCCWFSFLQCLCPKASPSPIVHTFLAHCRSRSPASSFVVWFPGDLLSVGPEAFPSNAAVKMGGTCEHAPSPLDAVNIILPPAPDSAGKAAAVSLCDWAGVGALCGSEKAMSLEFHVAGGAVTSRQR